MKSFFTAASGLVLAGAMASSNAVGAADRENSHSSPSSIPPSKVVDPNTGEMESLRTLRAEGAKMLKSSARTLKLIQGLQEDVELGTPVDAVADTAASLCQDKTDGKKLGSSFRQDAKLHVGLNLKDYAWALQQIADFQRDVVNPTTENEEMTEKACNSLTAPTNTAPTNSVAPSSP